MLRATQNLWERGLPAKASALPQQLRAVIRLARDEQ